MSMATYPIAGGDYERAGAASSGLKAMLKKVGVDAAALRRAMIAAYEAEMNVVIHSLGGEMRVMLEDGMLDVEVADEGPGIPDVELAMKEGYSTAPAKARQLGFGAGLGLPNIRKNSDRFHIESQVGAGTRVRFAILFSPQEALGRAICSVRAVAELCRECLRCLPACPTGAVRVRRGRPEVLEHLCVNCGSCIAACEWGALTVKEEGSLPRAGAAPLIVPAALLVQFGPAAGPRRALAELAALGFEEIWVTIGWHDALSDAVAACASEEGRVRPVISPVCPAVVSLVEMRFPSLIEYLAPFASPVEAAWRDAAGRDAVAVVGCPAEHSVLTAPRGHRSAEAVAPHKLVQAILRRIAEGGEGGEDTRSLLCEAPKGPWTAKDSWCLFPPDGVLRASGMRHVVAVLEAAEDGRLGDVPRLELHACEGGCFGSPLLREDPFVARWRWEQRGGEVPRRAGRAVRREQPFAARRGLRLAEDMGAAIARLAEIDRLVRTLPGRDCGLCGAPTCAALAEDIVLGRAERRECPYGGGK